MQARVRSHRACMRVEKSPFQEQHLKEEKKKVRQWKNNGWLSSPCVVPAYPVHHFPENQEECGPVSLVQQDMGLELFSRRQWHWLCEGQRGTSTTQQNITSNWHISLVTASSKSFVISGRVWPVIFLIANGKSTQIAELEFKFISDSLLPLSSG